MANLTLLYSGLPAEGPAVSFTAGLAQALHLRAESRFMAGVRAIIGAEQWRDYQTVVGLEGFASAWPLLDEKFQISLAERKRDADTALDRLPEARTLARGQPLELLHTPEAIFSSLGFTCDLLLASFEADPVIPDLLIRQTLLRGGGPIALVKEPLRARDFGESTVVVAWKPSIASKRAIQSALPILRAVKRVCVVSVGEYEEPPMNPDAVAIARYLKTCHQVPAEPHILRPADSPMQQLADFYQALGADLLVMGGYSHSRLQEIFFGGFTQHVTEKPFCNLYLVH